LYRGIEVNKIIRQIDPATAEYTGPPINSSKLGSQVMITIEITIQDYSSQIVIVDPLPGALEAVDENIFSRKIRNVDMFSDYWSWYIINIFKTREYRSDKVIITGYNVRAGTHSVHYVATVASEGYFTLPPTKVYDANQPELMGLSAGGMFTTKSFSSTNLINIDNSFCIPWKNRMIDISNIPDWMKSLKPTEDVEITSEDESILVNKGSLFQKYIITFTTIGFVLVTAAILTIYIHHTGYIGDSTVHASAIDDTEIINSNDSNENSPSKGDTNEEKLDSDTGSTI